MRAFLILTHCSFLLPCRHCAIPVFRRLAVTVIVPELLFYRLVLHPFSAVPSGTGKKTVPK